MPQGDDKKIEEHLSDAAYVWVHRNSERVSRIYYTLEYRCAVKINYIFVLILIYCLCGEFVVFNVWEAYSYSNFYGSSNIGDV
jgi:hypothetical protein